ncbi:MAG: hypothetical protein ACRDZ8_16560, partial [Acidimicrobiales bacterium]
MTKAGRITFSARQFLASDSGAARASCSMADRGDCGVGGEPPKPRRAPTDPPALLIGQDDRLGATSGFNASYVAKDWV